MKELTTLLIIIAFVSVINAFVIAYFKRKYAEPKLKSEQPQQPAYLEPAAVNGSFYIPSIHLSGFVSYLNYHGHDIKTMPPDMLRKQWRYYLQEISIED